MSEKLDLDALDRLLDNSSAYEYVTVQATVLRRLVRVAQGVQRVERGALVDLDRRDPLTVMRVFGEKAVREVRQQVEVEMFLDPESHPEQHRGTARAVAYVLDPLAARHL